MADTLNLSVKASFDWLLRSTLDLTTVADASKLEYSASLSSGTGPSQVDKIWSNQRTVAAGANDDLDLNTLVNTIFGSAITTNLAKVKGLLIVNTATAAGEDLVVGGSGGNEWSAPFGAAGHKARCPANSCLLLTAAVNGWPVVNGAADVLRINNAGAGSITYKIVLVGTSA